MKNKNMSKTDSNASKLGTEKVGRLLLNYSIPSIVSMIVVQVYSLVDRVFIGHGVGAMAISGLALTIPLMTLIAAIGTLIGVGASTRVSIVLGMNDIRWARNILGNALFLTFILSAIVVTPMMIFMEEMLALVGASPQTLPYAYDYLMIVIPGSIFTNITFSFSGIMRSAGYPMKSMVAIILGVTINAILDPILIFAMDMGIRGAAWATVISMFVTAVFVMSHFFNRKHSVHFRREAFKLKWRILRNITSIGLSPFLMNLAAVVVVVILNGRLYEYGGDLAIGAFGIINGYSLLFVMCVMGVCMGMQPIVGYNYGARNLKRMKDTLKLTIKVAVGIMTLGFLIVEIFPRQLAMAFTTDEELIEITKHGLRIVFAVFPVIGFQITVSNFFLSIGKVKQSIFMSLSRQVLLLIPFLYIFSAIWGLTGVWLSAAVSDLLAAVIAGFFLNYAKKYFYFNPVHRK